MTRFSSKTMLGWITMTMYIVPQAQAADFSFSSALGSLKELVEAANPILKKMPDDDEQPEDLEIMMNKLRPLIKAVMEKSSAYQFAQASNADPEQYYDYVINKDNSLVTKLNTTGWSVYVNETTQALWRNLKAIYVGVIGLFDVGKTHLISKITGTPLPMGFGVQTRGISGLAPRSSTDQLMFFDTAGIRRSVPIGQLTARTVTDQFVEDLILELCDAIVIVVNELSTDMQRKVMDLERRIYEEYKDSHPKKQIFIVHNLQAFTELDEVQKQIQWDIIDAFGAEKKIMDGKTYYYHGRGADHIRHFVYAAEGSQAGLHWNNNTLHIMKTFLKTMPADKIADPVASVTHVLPQVLQDYIQPYPEPIDERNETFIAKMIGKAFPRRLVKHVSTAANFLSRASGGYVTVLGPASAHKEQESSYSILSQNGFLKMAVPREMHFWVSPGSGRQFSPHMSMIWNKQEWMVQVDLPGVTQLLKWDEGSAGLGIQYTVRQKMRSLVIKGARPRPSEMTMLQEDGTYSYEFEHRSGENRFEPFRTSISVPPDVDTKEPEMTMNNGILKIKFKKIPDDGASPDEL